MRKENLREQAIHDRPVERPEGSFAGQVSGLTEMTNAKDGFRALGGKCMRLEKTLAIDKKPLKSVEKITAHQIGTMMTPIHLKEVDW